MSWLNIIETAFQHGMQFFNLISLKNKLGDTPLHSASWKGHPEIVQMLLAKGKLIIINIAWC